jgi:SHS2 domain-containing protein
MSYEIMDTAGDVGIRATGRTIEEALVDVGVGMYSLVSDISKIGDEKILEIEIKSDSPEGLVVSYLNDLIFNFDSYGFIGKRIEIAEYSKSTIRAKIFGEEFDLNVHAPRLLLKAATYHRIRVEQGSEGWLIEVIFDI